MAEVLSAQARVEFATAYCSVALPPAHSTQHTCACRDYQRSISRRITALPAHYLFAMVLKFDLLLRRLLILTSQAHSGLRVLSRVSFIAQKMMDSKSAEELIGALTLTTRRRKNMQARMKSELLLLEKRGCPRLLQKRCGNTSHSRSSSGLRLNRQLWHDPAFSVRFV